MIIGAGLDAQLRTLKELGCEKIFSEKRPRFRTAPSSTQRWYCREGDVFAVTKLDRLAQSVAGLGSAGRALRPSSLRQAAARRAASCASTAHVGCTPNPSGEHLAGGDRIELSVPGHDEF